MVTVGIDATRNRSGGAVAHLRGLIEGADPRPHGIGRVHLWGHDELLDLIKSHDWLTLHRVPATRQPIPHQLWWQYHKLPELARRCDVDVMFNSDAGSVCPFPLSATLSQDMLAFEPGEMRRYPLGSRARVRLELLKRVQLRRLQRSTLAIFLTDYARQIIARYVHLPSTIVIPHGIDQRFRTVAGLRCNWPRQGPIRCLYISNAAPYKHQWHVIEAVAHVRKITRKDLRLRLVGGGRGAALRRLLDAVTRFDERREFVEMVDFVPHDDIPQELTSAHIFIFASSCESLPITLLEAMAVGLPICSSARGPMPEVLGPNGAYFDPESPEEIASALISVLNDPVRRDALCTGAMRRAAMYTWEACADSTWSALGSLRTGNSK